MSDEMPKRMEMIFPGCDGQSPLLQAAAMDHHAICADAYAALFALAFALDDERSTTWIVAAVWLVAVFSAAVLVSFIIALKKFRRRIHWIHRNAFHEAERVELKLDERKGPFKSNPVDRRAYRRAR